MPDGRDGVEKRHHSSHWGAFQAHVRDGRMVGFEPFAKDPAPSPILESIQDAVYDESRVSQPMIRAGWLEGGPAKTPKDAAASLSCPSPGISPFRLSPTK